MNLNLNFESISSKKKENNNYNNKNNNIYEQKLDLKLNENLDDIL